MIFDDKKIIFIGPLGNPESYIVDQYDIVVRTNNFFSIDKKILKSTRCDVLIVNTLFSKNQYQIIEENINKVKFILAKNRFTYEILIDKIDEAYHHKILYMSYYYSKMLYPIKKQPLLVTIFLMYITQYFKPILLYFTGFDFYKSKNIDKFWLPGYETKQSLKFNILNLDKNSHDVESNIKFLKVYIDHYNWIKCDIFIQKIITESPLKT